MAVRLHVIKGLRAPEFEGGGPWINSEALKMKELRGSMVTVDFWTYSCVNCLRTLPYLKDWWKKYRDKGLVLVGVHTPEFDFEKDHENVERFCRENDVAWPVVLDNDYTIWNAYANSYWPRKYLVDKDGVIRYDHAGEGAYAETEIMIQQLLREVNPDVELPTLEMEEHAHRMGAVCFPSSPELYCGYERGRIGNREGYHPGKVTDYKDPGSYAENHIYLNGLWKNNAESMRHARVTRNLEDHIAILYNGVEVNAVIRPAKGGQFMVYATVDGAQVPGSMAGEDIQIDQGQSFLTVNEPRMYRVIKDRAYGAHVLRLASNSDEFEIYAYTFGGCLET